MDLIRFVIVAMHESEIQKMWISNVDNLLCYFFPYSASICVFCNIACLIQISLMDNDNT